MDLVRSVTLVAVAMAALVALCMLLDRASAIECTPTVKRRVALLLRGHVRDAFDGDATRRFVQSMIRDARMEVDVYVQTWDHREAQQGCSWRAVQSKREAVSASDIHAYLQCKGQAATVLVIPEASVRLVGPADGLLPLPGTSAPRRGWKHMWYGKSRAFRLIEERGVDYDATVSMRLDFFGAYVSSRHDYGFSVTAATLRDWICVNASSGDVRFLVDRPTLGIDNCYIGPTALMRRICTTFHEELDRTCARLGRDVHQEKMVYWLAAEVNADRAKTRLR
jgi:hypothetical protein